MHLFTSKCDTTNYGGKIVKNAGMKCEVQMVPLNVFDFLLNRDFSL